MRFLQGALVILVLKQMSQFRSFGKWVKIRCLPDTTFARSFEDNSREELGASRCFWDTVIHKILRKLFWTFWQITQRVSPYSFVVIFMWVFGFYWSTRCVSPYSITDTLTFCWCVMLCRNHGFLRYRCRRCRWSWAWSACRQTRDNDRYVSSPCCILSVCYFWWVVVSWPLV